MHCITKDSLNSLIHEPLAELISYANKVRQQHMGSELELCSIVNAKSGLCTEDCKFCAQSSRHKAEVSVYPLIDKGEILAGAFRAKEVGAKKFGIVTSGNKLTDKELDIIAQAVYDIKNKVGISICGSLGALNKSELKRLKEAGLTRYHHNIETSPRYYSQIVSTHNFQERIKTIKAAKSVGLQVCSGGIIGMGESWQDRIDMAYLLKELNVDSVPINLLVPIKGTPMDGRRPISCNDAIRTICIFRIVLENRIIKIAAGRESVFKDFQGLGFMAGANGMLIGGYLTLRGRDVEMDHKLIEEIKEIWKE
ncbi:MAG: biotin synthase BioB [Candidatus Omnitrophica bacterium]|nr:biotin synthase BioB [Candidatus Omnitrophota bacterium]